MFKIMSGRSHLLRLVVFHLPEFQAASRTGCCSPGVRLGGNMPTLILTSSSQIFPATIPGVWTLSVRATSWSGRGGWRGGGGWGGGGTGQTRVETQNLARWCWEATRLLGTRTRRRWTSLINIWNRQQTHDMLNICSTQGESGNHLNIRWGRFKGGYIEWGALLSCFVCHMIVGS